MESGTPQRQKEIYLNGFAGRKPLVPVPFEKLEQAAQKKLSPRSFAYIAGGAGAERSIHFNRDAFDKISILPRVLRDVSERHTEISLLGNILPSPVLLSPIGVLELAHRHADLAVARAAASMEIPFVFSNQASVPMEDCAAAMGTSPHWFQLYRSKSDELVESFLSRAEKCGCGAIVVTLDTTLLGWRPRDLDLGYLPFLEGKGIAQYTADPVFQKMMDQPFEEDAPRRITRSTLINVIKLVHKYPMGNFFSKLLSGKPLRAVRTFIETYSNAACTWEDLNFIRSHTNLPIFLKGILHPDDALKAMDAGMDGIIISNHGGRQVDGAIPPVVALPGIVKVVNKKIPVLMDSGIRSGADVFLGLALGATAVCLGRPYAYGLALGGEAGVREVLFNLLAEFELTMALSGCATVADINESCLSFSR